LHKYDINGVVKEGIKKKVYVGLSGGVDSSVSVALLQEQGFDVTGVFIKVWNPDFLECDWQKERRDAMRVCARLRIPFITLDLEKEYKQGVADYMIEEYKAGRTPNPDVMCNKEVKFGAFLKFALESGADYIATGHYVHIKEKEEPIHMYESVDKNKDQSYFLWTLTQEQLKHSLFPVGGMKKDEVRKLALKFNLPTATKKDSQGVCFLGPLDMKEFLKHYVNQEPGDVLDIEGKVIGKHDGAIFYTVGERIGYEVFHKGSADLKMYVVAKDIHRNTVTVSPEPREIESNPYLVSKIKLSKVNWIGTELIENERYGCRIRYRQEPISCRVEDEYIKFEDLQPGISIGQSAVIYDGEQCLGGGVIEEVM